MAYARKNQWDSVDASGRDWNAGEEFDPTPAQSAQQKTAATTQTAATSAPAAQASPGYAAGAFPSSAASGTLSQLYANNAAQTPISHADTSGVRSYLEQSRDAAVERASGQIDRAVTQGVNELWRTRREAEEQYDTTQNQIARDERRALDNQALYAAARGDKGGIGAAQYDAIQNAAAQNRMTVHNARTKMRTDIGRQMAELRANGEFQKSDALLQATQQFLAQMAQLEQWAMSTNVSIDQFNAQMEQAQRDYNLQLAQLGLQQYQWEQSFAYQKERDATADKQWETAFNRNVYESDRNYERGVLESDRAYDRSVLESDRSYEFQVQAYKDSLEQQAKENGWKQQEIDLQLRAYEDGLKQQQLENQMAQQQLAAQQRQQFANSGLTKINNGISSLSNEELEALNMTRDEASTLASVARAREALGLEQLELGNASAKLSNEAAQMSIDAAKSAGSGSYSFGDATSRLFADAKASGKPESYISNHYKDYGLSSSSGLYSDYKNWLSGVGNGGMSYEDALAEAQAGRWSDAIYEGLSQRLSPADIKRYFGKSREEYDPSDYNDYMENGYLDKIKSLPRETIGDNAKPMEATTFIGYKDYIGKMVSRSQYDAAQDEVGKIWNRLSYAQRIELLTHLYGFGFEASF